MPYRSVFRPGLFAGQTVIVTGGGSGFGRCTAHELAHLGAHVVLIGRRVEKLQTVAAELEADNGSGCASCWTADIRDEERVKTVIGEIVAARGRIDALVNNAGITQPVKTLDISGRDYDRILDVSLRGTLYMSQAVLPAMLEQQGGSIVCISSVSAQRGGGILGGPHYSAAKAGVLGLARAMAREFGPQGIRINSVTPGLIGTDIIKGKLDETRKAEIAETIPLARLGRAEDIAGACVFLASDLSAYCTGITLDVNGGMLIH